jgi:hypothetical protein
MKVDLASTVDVDKDVTRAVDSSGIKVSNRGERIHRKWRVQRGFIKVRLAVDVKTKQILAIEVAKEDVGDGKMFGRLLKGSADVASVKRVIGDGAYDSRDSFLNAGRMDIDALIRVRKNANPRLHGCLPRRLAVLEQLGNPEWRRERGYGYRWMVESAFSSVKRVFGEYICAVKRPNIVKELLLKASIYNLFMKMNLN